MRIQRTPQAQADLLAIHAYIDDDNPSAADRFLDQVEWCLEALTEMPGMGRAWESDSLRLAGIRVYPVRRFRNYLLFYRQIPGGIELITVLHGARDLALILESIPLG